MSHAVIRFAQPQDAQAILQVYHPFVLHSTATFTLTDPQPQEYAQYIHQISQTYPFLICELGGIPVAFAYACNAVPQSAYCHNAELAIYIDPLYQRRRIGRALYSVLLSLLAEQNVYNIYAGVVSDNAGSIAFHEAQGFTVRAVFPQNGYKFGRWHDVLWLHYTGISPPITPETFIPIDGLHPTLPFRLFQDAAALIRCR